MEPRAVGTVVLVDGVAIARSADGRRRQLKIGDKVYEGEVIETVADAQVELAFEQAGHFVLRSRESVTLGSALFDSLVADEDLPRGGCRVEGDTGIAEAGFETRWQAVMARLGRDEEPGP